MKRIFTYILLIATIVLFGSCNYIWLCKETEKTIKNAKKYTEYQALSVENIKSILRKDTTKYKIIDFYSTCCGPCIYRFQYVFPEKLKKYCSNNTEVYFIQNNTSSLKYSDTFLKMISQYDTDTNKYKYYLLDTNYRYSDFKAKNKIDALTNLTNDIFDNEEFIVSLGLPHSMVVNKTGNKIMVRPCKFSDGSVAHTPLSLDYIDRPLNKLDFNSIWKDTLYLPYEMDKNLKMFCTPDGKCR